MNLQKIEKHWGLADKIAAGHIIVLHQMYHHETFKDILKDKFPLLNKGWLLTKYAGEKPVAFKKGILTLQLISPELQEWNMQVKRDIRRTIDRMYESKPKDVYSAAVKSNTSSITGW